MNGCCMIRNTFKGYKLVSKKFRIYYINYFIKHPERFKKRVICTEEGEDIITFIDEQEMNTSVGVKL